MPRQQQTNQTKDQSIEQFAPDTSTSMQAPKRFGGGVTAKLANKKKFIIILVIVLVGLGAIGFGVKTFLDLRNTKKELSDIKNDPNAKAKEEAKNLVEQVGKIAILPENEEPTVATVTDPSKLSDQPFFAHSKAGDKVLIYQEASRAILYRPSENKIIEIAPLTIGGDNSIAPPPGDQPAPATSTPQ